MDSGKEIFTRALFVMVALREHVLCYKSKTAVENSDKIAEETDVRQAVLGHKHSELATRRDAIPSPLTEDDFRNHMRRIEQHYLFERRLKAEFTRSKKAEREILAECLSHNKIFHFFWCIVFEDLVEPRFWENKECEWYIPVDPESTDKAKLVFLEDIVVLAG